jgi:hypothetical protein
VKAKAVSSSSNSASSSNSSSSSTCESKSVVINPELLERITKATAKVYTMPFDDWERGSFIVEFLESINFESPAEAHIAVLVAIEIGGEIKLPTD